MTDRRFKLAAAQYPIDWLGGWQAYVAKVTAWVEGAVAERARLLVFPEYGGMELASLFPEPVPGDLQAQLPAVASLEAQVVELHRGWRGGTACTSWAPACRSRWRPGGSTTVPGCTARTGARLSRTRS